MKESTLRCVIENEALIGVLAERFGFDNEVRITKGSWNPSKESTTLHLVVKEIPGNQDVRRCSKLLEVKLAAQLNCKVDVVAHENFPPHCVPLSEVNMCSLFNIRSLNEITLKNWGDAFPVERLIEANQYLADKAADTTAEESKLKKLKR